MFQVWTHWLTRVSFGWTGMELSSFITFEWLFRTWSSGFKIKRLSISISFPFVSPFSNHSTVTDSFSTLIDEIKALWTRPAKKQCIQLLNVQCTIIRSLVRDTANLNIYLGASNLTTERLCDSLRIFLVFYSQKSVSFSISTTLAKLESLDAILKRQCLILGIVQGKQGPGPFALLRHRHRSRDDIRLWHVCSILGTKLNNTFKKFTSKIQLQ